ncbi:hypothetical protein QJS04_geneDACA000171 [Acorus gramineus]|uniref:SOSEKI DIX-like domain-containing protein n=1 Tax=Acorus gramineus TaxID=55184 RepID=A0AAV9ATE6_ACOGR|nr:hypothetical protein QJS04_geneDACA000171 [Acorus gramineus]
MAAMYSWSCKRSYKNGFVWHDLSEDDLILPGQGNEYVLKGSELLDESPPDRNNHSSTTSKHQNPKASSQELATSRSQDASSSSSSSIRESKQPAPQLRSPPPPPSNEEDMSLAMSPDLVVPRRSPQPSWGGGGSSPSLTEYKIYQSNGAADASTQTEERPKKEPHPNLVTCTRWVSTEDVPLVPKRSPEINVVDDVVSPPPTSSSGASSSGGKTETLESLIRADANRMNSFRILEEEELLYPGEGSSKMKATDVLLQLITCGSISVKDHHSFGLIPTYKPRFSHVKFPSSMMFSSGPVGLRELDCLSENPRMVGLRMEDKEYFSGSLIEMKKHKDEGEVFVTLKRSSSYNAERNCKPVESTTDRERSSANSPRSKCLPRTIKISSNRQSKNEMMRSPLSDGGARKSSVGNDRTSQSTSLPTSKGGSKRFTEPSSAKGTSKDGKVIKIEESLLRELGL